MLRLVKSAVDRSDASSLDDLRTIAENDDTLYDYISAQHERLIKEERSYYIYDDETFASLTSELEKIGFGDFDEAMMALEYDLNSLERYRDASEVRSNIFRPELFNQDDRVIWTELRKIVTEHDYKKRPADDDNCAAVEQLRTYQQKSFGPLVPVMIATYIDDASGKKHGVSVQLSWTNNHLYVQTAAPFAKELDDYFANKASIKTVQDFTEKSLPATIGDYVLSYVSSMDLFEYELTSKQA